MKRPHVVLVACLVDADPMADPAEVGGSVTVTEVRSVVVSPEALGVLGDAAAIGFQGAEDWLEDEYVEEAFRAVGVLTGRPAATYDFDDDGAPCCPDPDCNGRPCTFPGYADNH